MHLFKLGLLALVVEQAYGYLNASPFFMFSTSELLTSNSQLRSAASLTAEISHTLSQCLSTIYVVVYQHGVKASDYSSSKTIPGLFRYMNSKEKTKVRSSAYISEVVGEIDMSRWEEVLQKTCGAKIINVGENTEIIDMMDKRTTTVLNVHLPQPIGEHRTQTLMDNDAFFASILDTLPSQNYTVLYTTTPGLHPESFHETTEYEMESLFKVMHPGVKRDLDSHPSNSNGNATYVDGPLFERYQFLSPGLFMGFTAGILLLFILYYAIAGVASLQVSYAAFDKEQGQLAQKKGQ